jgi:hypothetical protein
MFIILLGDPENGDIDYIGIFDDPITASTYAAKHFRKQPWRIAVLIMKDD